MSKSHEVIKAALSLKFTKKFLGNGKLVLSGTCYTNGAVVEREVVFDDIPDEKTFKQEEGWVISAFLHEFYCVPEE